MQTDQNHLFFLPQSTMSQLAHFAPKEWGHEEWIVNNEKYCGKKLVFKKNYRCSMHYHKIKEETFYIISGKVLLETIDNDVKKKRVMVPGDIEHIKPHVLHRLTGLENSQVMEFSTFHMESDSYRVEMSGFVDTAALCCSSTSE
jgi:quercetin dioxygenase-like cupin family protein